MRELVQWQKIDERSGLVFPWFTHPFLEELQTWSLHDKRILEYGGGRSTVWWAFNCAMVHCIEAKEDFAISISRELDENNLLARSHIICNPDWREGDRMVEDSYVKAYETFEIFDGEACYDIVVVDGIFRYECMIEGIKLLVARGGRIIVDNWDQDGFLCPACVELLKPYEGYIFAQPGHTDHHGNCWKTAFFEIPAHA